MDFSLLFIAKIEQWYVVDCSPIKGPLATAPWKKFSMPGKNSNFLLLQTSLLTAAA